MNLTDKIVNPPNVPNVMPKEWYINVKKSIEEAIEMGACKKMDFDYNFLYFVDTKAASPMANGQQHSKWKTDEDGVLLTDIAPKMLNIAC